MTKYNMFLSESNPSTQYRHSLLLKSLRQYHREDDYENIINLLSPPIDITNIPTPNKPEKIKIGVIGGGLSGMSAAFELRKLGFNITIYEALESRIGGKIYTHYFDKSNLLYGELGAMRIPVSHETSWHYINLFNLNTRPFVQKNQNGLVYIKNTRVRNDFLGKNITEKIYPKFKLTPQEMNTPWPDLINYALNFYLMKLPSHIRKEILQIKEIYSPQYTFLSNISIRQAFESLNLSQGAIDMISSIDIITGQFLYNSYSQILQEYYTLDFASLYEIEGGMVNLPLAFYNSLLSANPKEYSNIPNENLGTVKWNGGTYITGIHFNKYNKKVILEKKSSALNKAEYEEFDYVICTVPFSILRSINITPLFSNRKMQAIREVNYSDSQKTLLLCKNRFWEENGPTKKIIGGLSYTDLLISTIVYPSNNEVSSINNLSASSKDPGVLVASYNLNLDAVRLGNMDEDQRINLIKRQVEEVHALPKGYLDSIVLDYKTLNWNNEQWFRGAFSIFLPEQKRIFMYDMSKPEYENRVFFAGDHVSPKRAWIQGALQSGMIAANNLAYAANNHSLNHHMYY